MSDTQTLQIIQDAFGSVPRPDKFTCEDGDFECMEKDATLHAWRLELLRIEDVTNIGYDPWTECVPQGKAYFLPAMARLALGQERPCEEWYAGWLGGRLGSDSGLFDYCSPSQREAILAFLDHLLETRAEVAEEECFLNELIKARAHLSGAIRADESSV